MNDVLQQYHRDYENLAPKMPGANITWIEERRQAAFSVWEKLGFPTRKVEDWKYSSTHALAQLPFQARSVSTRSTSYNLDAFLLPDTLTVFIRDGELELLSSLPVGVELVSLAEAFEQDLPELKSALGACSDVHHHEFTALNTAMMAEGLLLIARENVQIATPIHFIYLNSQNNQVLHPRHLFILESNAQLNIIETYISEQHATTFTNVVCEASLATNAKLTHYKLIQESPAAYHIGTFYARVAKDAALDAHSFALSGNFVRSDTWVELSEPHAYTSLNGLYAPALKEHIDHHTTILHQAENGTSREHYRGMATDAAHAVFNGQIHVARDAQKTVARQQNKNLLLSKQAEVDTKPQLDIAADDVQCTHGATVGQLDADAIFYFATRGIAVQEATQYLIQAFAADNLKAIAHDEFAAWLKSRIVGANYE